MVVTDIPRAFLHTDMDEEVHMLLEGTIAEIIVKLEPKLYRKYTRRNKKACVVCETEKVSLWDTPGSATVLEATIC